MNKTNLHIVLITSGQPSLNPRLVKEGDALVEAGYEVTVIYQFWNAWATLLDEDLLATKKWKVIRVGGDPNTQKIIYWKTRLRHKLANTILSKFDYYNVLATLAIGRCSTELINYACNIPADLYIAHNLAALPAAVKAAKKNKSKCGFDAEDFHRHEVSNDSLDFDVKLKTYIENKYIQQLDYLITASPLISDEYSKLFPTINPITILNTFPKKIKNTEKKPSKKLRLFWFSQTIGRNRGLEEVIEALLKFEKEMFELHLLGKLDAADKHYFLEEIGGKTLNIYFYEPIAASEIISFASEFDIGLATELSSPKNRDICLTNKIFTYVQAGLAIIASNTLAQKAFMQKYPNMGYIFDQNLASVLNEYIQNDHILKQQQLQASQYGKETVNWEYEKPIFLTIIENTLNTQSEWLS